MTGTSSAHTYHSLPPALILAGGKGTRIRSAHPELPKPLIPVAGKPFLVWQLDWLAQNGVDTVILSIGYQAQKIKDYFTAHPPRAMHLHFHEENEPLGTGGAIKSALQHCETDYCFICNGDSLCPVALAPLYENAKNTEADVVIVASRVDDASDYGAIASDDDGRIHGFYEKGETSGPADVNAGIYCIRTAWAHTLSRSIPLSIENDVFPTLTPDALRIFPTETPFIDIGVPSRLHNAHDILPRMFTTLAPPHTLPEESS